MDTVGEGESWANGKRSIHIYTLSGVRRRAGKRLLWSRESSLVLCDGLEWGEVGRGGVLEGRDVCIIMADLHCCMAETNTVL